MSDFDASDRDRSSSPKLDPGDTVVSGTDGTPAVTPEPARSKRRWTDYDWIWNTLTVTCLVVSGSFITNTAQAFSQDGWDVLQMLGTVGQGAGLAFVTGGALTSQGRKALEQAMSSLGIAPKYQAEVSFLFAAATVGVSATINTNLPRLGEYYYQKGYDLALKGQVGEAISNFEEALHFIPNDVRTNIALGDYYEQGARHDLALTFYGQAVNSGNPRALMGIARIHMRANPTLQGLQTAELYFRLALAQPRINPVIRSQLLAYMGILHLQQAQILSDFPPMWDQVAFQAALEQDRQMSYTFAPDYLPDGGVMSTRPLERVLSQGDPIQHLQAEAKRYLEAAAQLEQDLAEASSTTQVPGYGMPHCYLGILYTEMENVAQSQLSWQRCAETAVPASLEQMAEILSYGGSEIADLLDTSIIIQQANP